MFNKRFSIPHWDGNDDDEAFYNAFIASSHKYKEEIRDIYFGAEFIYLYKGQRKRYGEVMGVTASDKQIDNLFKIQNEFGVECSMTLNSLNIPSELSSDISIVSSFIKFIRKYYDKGLRSCTISCTHLMRTGKLQQEFPKMRWKNTVNHQVKTTQELYDYAALGYNTLIFDRSLNRDADILKEMYSEAKKLNIEVSLLASESCLPSCPFKTEHDSWQEELEKSNNNYWSAFTDTCPHWRKAGILPRSGTNISMATKELVDFYMKFTDVLKFSGRLSGNTTNNIKLCWNGSGKLKTSVLGAYRANNNNFEYADSFDEIYTKELEPYIQDRWLPTGWAGNDIKKRQHKNQDLETIWHTKKGVSLSKILSNCKNRCWSCHACEKVFGVEKFNSVLEL